MHDSCAERDFWPTYISIFTKLWLLIYDEVIVKRRVLLNSYIYRVIIVILEKQICENIWTNHWNCIANILLVLAKRSIKRLKMEEWLSWSCESLCCHNEFSTISPLLFMWELGISFKPIGPIYLFWIKQSKCTACEGK